MFIRHKKSVSSNKTIIDSLIVEKKILLNLFINGDFNYL